MNAGATAERVYDAVKRRVLAGAWRPGERIEVAALAEQLASSNTPVRDALHLLAGERLVETRAGDGFHAPLIDAPMLTDLYDWNTQLLLQATRRWIPAGATAELRMIPLRVDAAGATKAAFARIAARTGNVEYQRVIDSASDRLHAVRIAESAVIADWRPEIADLEAEIEADNAASLRRLILAYHRRRARIVMETLRALHQTGAPT
jgi:DNA-binding GntR family transcriptional regulator